MWIVNEIESGRGWRINFVQDDTLGDLLGFEPKVIHDDCSKSDCPFDNLSSDNVLLTTDIAQVMIFKGKRSGNIHNLTMDVNPGYKYVGKFRGGVQWYMI